MEPISLLVPSLNLIDYSLDLQEKIRWNRDDFVNRMKLFSINFESALSTFSTAVRTFNDVAMDDGMTIAQSNAVINNIADILDKNFVKARLVES